MNFSGEQSCPLCGCVQTEQVLTGFDCLCSRAENYDYVRCRDCGLVFISPMPDAATIATFYQGSYEPHDLVDTADLIHRERRAVNRFLARYLYGTHARQHSAVLRVPARFTALFAMHNTLLPFRDCRLLDVGCGSGRWLYRHQRLGWQAEGVELTAAAVERARDIGLTVYQGTITDVPGRERFDVVSFRHVLEHVPDPLPTLDRALQLLVPGGMLFIQVPNFDSYGRRRYGPFWYPLDPPRHLLQFSPAVMQRLAQRLGLRVIGLKTEVQTRMLLQSEHYEQTLGEVFAQTTSSGQRRAALAECARTRDTFLQASKLRRKLLFMPTWWRSRQGQGETIKAVFVKP